MNLQSLGAVAIVDTVLSYAKNSRTSDIHVDPRDTTVTIRIRVDGDLQILSQYPQSIHAEVVSRIKVLAGLRLDEHYVPQDGRFRVGDTYDVRVSIMPSYFGEAIVLRLLQPYDDSITLQSLGFSEVDTQIIRNALSKTSGMILVAGPTGSGKTTTLYTLLRDMLSPHKSIVTIEDPIEYILPHARQVPVKGDRMSFATILRSVLRQDPNIIMVGEIRDEETARVSITAALTGHFVLSTIHTYSAEATVSRLRNMGIEKYLIDATVSLVIAQRLVPKKDQKGRLVIYEILSVGKGETVPARTLIEDGLAKARDGLIELEHVMAIA